MTARIFIALCFCACATSALLADENSGTTTRRHSDGVLTRFDFQAAIPSDRDGLDAMVHTRLHYDYRYRYRRRDGQFELICAGIRCVAEVLPDRSWMNSLGDNELLDHEQGHFDLAEIAARRGQLELEELIEVRRLRGVGDSLADAEKDLERRIELLLKRHDDALDEANQEYDERTQHGLVRGAQRRERAAQRAALAEMQAEDQDSE